MYFLKLMVYLKRYKTIFKRILSGYKYSPNNNIFSSAFEYTNKDNIIKIILLDNKIRILKKEDNKEIIEELILNKNEVFSKEIIKEYNKQEIVERSYQESLDNLKLISLKSTFIINDTKHTISVCEDKTLINNRDLSLLFEKDKNKPIEERYNKYRKLLSNSKQPSLIQNTNNYTPSKSKRKITLEENLRRYIKENFNYKAPLDKRNLDDLIRIIMMLNKRKELPKAKIKQYKKVA